MQTINIEGFKLSPQQRRLWLLQQDNLVYRTQCVIRVNGKLEAEVLKAALEQVVTRHEILRTIFHKQPGIKIPIQVITERGKICWNHINLKNLNLREQSAKIEQLFHEQGRLVCTAIPAELLSEVLRSSLITLSDSQSILLLTLPALYADSWTLKNIVRELSHSYNACLRGEELSDEPVQYIQFSEWQNELLEDEEAKEGKDYWGKQNFQSVTLPFEAKSSRKTSFEPKVYALNLNADAVAIEGIALRHNITISEFLFACWQTLIWRLTGQSDFTVSTLLSGRKYEELHSVMGLLAKWLPVRCSFQKNLQFSEVLLLLSKTLHQINQWQDYFVEESIYSASNTQNLPISFEFEDWSEKYCADKVLLSIEQQYVCFECFKLKLNCTRLEESLVAEFHYDTELFDIAAIQCIAEQFQTLVESAANNPEAPINELNMLSDRTRHQLLDELNNTQVNYPEDKCIHNLFEQQVEHIPNNIAVVFEDQQLTYAELNKRANKLAHYLQRQGITPEVLVGIYTERSLDTIIALLGVLKAGGAYLPLDPALPKESLTFRLQDAQVPILLTQKGLIKRQNGLPNIVYLDADWGLISQESEVNLTSKLSIENLAYVIYTSGSAGHPKGVAIEHRQILNYLYAIQDKLELLSSASFATVSTFAADLGNTAIFPTLCTGGCLHIISQDRASDSEALAKYFLHHPIDCLKIVPSHITTLLASSISSSILPRQTLVLGGEAASWDLIEKVQHYAPNCRILNHYGPTETTVGVLTYLVKSKQASYNAKTVPIGRAIANTQVYLLDERLQLVPIGVPGELYIGGASLARGYLNRPELSAEKFITIENIGGQDTYSTRVYKTGDMARYLPDGTIEFLGRIDNQVKIRGFRVELGEIEAVLSQCPGVKQAVVSLSEDESGNKRLVGYVVPDPKQTPSISDLRSFCLTKLSEYSVPSVFLLLKKLPLTPNGKVDRHTLPSPENTRPELEAVYIAPRSLLEKEMAEIWAQVLSIEKVGIHDNFFDLGGHSLLITQLLAEIRDRFKVNLSLRSLFELPTVANVAKKIASLQQAPNIKIDTQDTIDLKAEAVLDPSIYPSGTAYNPNVTPSTIFLTGSTGFLGAFLLYELLQQTQADIYCLVRSETIELGKKKIQSSLQSYLIWDESFSQRIIPVLGDLSQPLLGFDEKQFQLMASKIDVIYHNGALVNFTYPYSVLKEPNVLGTQEVLRLACFVKVKLVHFISTISTIYPSKSNILVVREQDSLDNAQKASISYTQSKWVAEKLVTIARERYLPVCIYRPGRISGHSKTGVCNPGDHTYRMIKGCIQLGSIPDKNLQMNLSPVDYMSKAIVYLSRQKESLKKAFHLVNPQPLALSEMVNYIRSLGYPIELVDYEKWRTQLINTPNSPENALYPLLTVLSEETSNSASDKTPLQQLDCHNTITGLAETSITCPPVNTELLKTYFSYLIQIGFLNPPTV
ncbi:MAG: amino acid adenylation domain-containing protein [Scytonematopsis contorta HA4267-MV1]|jgi:amino acid adenylation domain-containing protein/thioester reductase-like protein|nr:amino acid adenylation domain-containing protein [Scytonematopsis contorta HA4267-MV1]